MALVRVLPAFGRPTKHANPLGRPSVPHRGQNRPVGSGVDRRLTRPAPLLDRRIQSRGVGHDNGGLQPGGVAAAALATDSCSADSRATVENTSPGVGASIRHAPRFSVAPTRAPPEPTSPTSRPPHSVPPSTLRHQPILAGWSGRAEGSRPTDAPARSRSDYGGRSYRPPAASHLLATALGDRYRPRLSHETSHGVHVVSGQGDVEQLAQVLDRQPAETRPRVSSR